MYVFMVDSDSSHLWNYAHDDLRCVIHYILAGFGHWFLDYDEESYDSIGFDWRHPYDNNLETWNDLLAGFECEIFKVTISNNVFVETEKYGISCIKRDVRKRKA